MRLKGIFVGLIGGVVLSGLMYYPCYVFLPGKFITSWSHGRTDLTCVCLTFSLIVLIAIGVLGGRWSGLDESKTFLGGAAAGGIAMFIAYGLIISPATGVLGNKEIFRYGLVEVKDELSLSWLVFYGVTGTIWWGVAGFWISILSGSIIGALGGWAAESVPDLQFQWSKLFSFIDPFMTFMAMLNYFIMYAIFGSFVGIVENGMVQYRISSQYPISVALMMLTATPYIWVLFWQLKLWSDLHSFQKQFEIQRPSWVFSSFVALILPILLWLMAFPSFKNTPFFFWTATLSAVVGILTFRDAFWKKRYWKIAPVQYPFSELGLILQGGIVASLFMSLTLMMGNLVIPLNLVLITVTAIGSFSGSGGGDPQSVLNMVNSVYTMPVSIFEMIFIVISVYFLLVIWTLGNTINFLQDYGFRILSQTPKQEPDGESSG
ncbi:MAG: hypothetical protein U0V02_13560 [Anaerolineales bacterium]